MDRTDHREYRIGYSNGPRSNILYGAISKSKKGQAFYCLSLLTFGTEYLEIPKCREKGFSKEATDEQLKVFYQSFAFGWKNNFTDNDVKKQSEIGAKHFRSHHNVY